MFNLCLLWWSLEALGAGLAELLDCGGQELLPEAQHSPVCPLVRDGSGMCHHTACAAGLTFLSLQHTVGPVSSHLT